MTRTERQNLAVRKWIENKGRGTCAWATGTGKTRIALIAIKSFIQTNHNKTIRVIVPTEHLKLQWIMELDKFGLGLHVKVEIINSAVKNNEKVDLIVLDELHRYASNLFIQIFKVRKPSLILGLSATFHRLDGRHKILERFCPVIDTITVKEALENGWLSDYREYKVLVEVDDFHIYEQASLEFQDSFSFFDFDFNLAMSCVTNIIKRRVYAKKMGIDHKTMDAITFTWQRSMRARKDFIMNHPEKLEITRKILNARPFAKAITFSGTIKQAEKIGIGQTVHSGKTKRKNRMTIEEFSKMPTGVLNTSKSLDEGADIPGLSLAVILTNSSSPTQKIQRIGRVIRKEEGKLAEVFTLVLKGTVEERWFENSSQFSSYIEIDEEELDFILDGGEINRQEKDGKDIDEMFRL